ncbi:MAG: glycosyltransferase family 39 protein [Acidobacteria bacterium]|nr:glycosyltransferase family 39 protein [Acidobacteriota bacterium]
MTISRSERLLAMVIAAVTLAMRAVAFFHYRFDSDEPQHLHVVWGWTAGLLQYRDVFDNHAPLFHMAMAPLLRVLGERPDILFFMRAPMLILWIIVSAAAFLIAKRLYGDRIAMWSVLLLNVLPTFFLKSIEFRTDNLWNACWLVGVLMLVDASPDPARKASRYQHLFLGGVLFGCAFSISLKTSLLLFSLAAAAIVTWSARIRGREPSPFGRRDIALIGAGFVIIPALIVFYFVALGAWSNFVYCAFRFNAIVTLTRPALLVWTPRLLFVPLIIVALRIAWRYRQTTTNGRFFFAVATAVFFATLWGFWILISPRDFLPFLPFVSMFVVAALARDRRFLADIAVLLVICLIGVGYYAQWLTNGTREFITMERQALNLTRPGEPVMDYKGETIYRRRPYYFILEFITRNAILHGLIPDTVAEDLVRAGCHVAQADGPQWPDHARTFMEANFLNLGRLRASGQWLQPNGSFSIAIPGEYVILGKNGHAGGLLDGTPYRGGRPLAAGVHRFTSARGNERLACLWAPAFARGFSPFHLRDLDF